jgi:hypothetical protein
MIRAPLPLLLGLSCAALLSASSSNAAQAPDSRRPPSLGGVVATIRLPKTTIKVGERLPVTLTLLNTTTRPIVFRYPVLGSGDERIFSRGREVPYDCAPGEKVAFDVTLQPGIPVDLPQEVPVEWCWHLRRGFYSIHFYYHLGLLPDQALAKQYARRYHAADGVFVRWSGQLHFTVVG